MKKKVVVNNDFQKNYVYYLTEEEGKSFAEDFKPDLKPWEMLKLGVFGGHYMEPEAWKEFPREWLEGVKLSSSGEKEKQLNFFKVRASQSLEVWQEKGWIYENDPYGWFQWYCRYWMGRRLSEEDERQIRRWKAIRRHATQVRKNCRKGDLGCRPRQRQALLHWAYDSRKI
jgi:hypothetical protein